MDICGRGGGGGSGNLLFIYSQVFVLRTTVDHQNIEVYQGLS